MRQSDWLQLAPPTSTRPHAPILWSNLSRASSKKGNTPLFTYCQLKAYPTFITASRRSPIIRRAFVALIALSLAIILPTKLSRFLNRRFATRHSSLDPMAWRSSGSSNEDLIENLYRHKIIQAERVRDAMKKACNSPSYPQTTINTTS